jgi:hypothetical protein
MRTLDLQLLLGIILQNIISDLSIITVRAPAESL